MAVIVFARGDDWSGLYADGVLLDEDHTLRVDIILQKLVGTTIDSYRMKYIDEDWLVEEGFLPRLLKDVRFEEDTEQ